MGKTIAIVSGGMDSVTLSYLLKSEGRELHLLSFDYGQRHAKELASATACANALGCKHDVIDLRSIGEMLGGSSLTDDIPVPDGRYDEQSMRITVVPNRNAIMLAIAYGVAVAERADSVAIGVHAGDHFIYPDCRPDFIFAFDAMQKWAIDGFGNVALYAPFLSSTKSDIVKIGEGLSVPYDQTWSCYKGGAVHCGTCGTCTERIEAFQLAGVKDPTEYLVKVAAKSTIKN
jgi:7-cyano-7-deazaguanine synthase